MGEVALEHPHCPYCHEEVRPGESAKQSCEDCMTWHHLECWTQSGGCSACGQRNAGVVEGVPHPARPRTPASRQPDKALPVSTPAARVPSGPPRGVGLLGLLLLAAGGVGSWGWFATTRSVGIPLDETTLPPPATERAPRPRAEKAVWDPEHAPLLMVPSQIQSAILASDPSLPDGAPRISPTWLIHPTSPCHLYRLEVASHQRVVIRVEHPAGSLGDEEKHLELRTSYLGDVDLHAEGPLRCRTRQGELHLINEGDSATLTIVVGGTLGSYTLTTKALDPIESRPPLPELVLGTLSPDTPVQDRLSAECGKVMLWTDDGFRLFHLDYYSLEVEAPSTVRLHLTGGYHVLGLWVYDEHARLEGPGFRTHDRMRVESEFDAVPGTYYVAVRRRPTGRSYERSYCLTLLGD
jgi:hypothetical protein